MQNILFILLDQLRYDTLGFMNTFPVQTPNIDALARSGTVFDNAYCTNPVCVPARASIMTGRYSYDHGVYYNDQNWSDRLPTFADHLSKNGYYTTLVGKTHFFPPRKTAGFQKIVVQADYKAYLAKRGMTKKPGGGKTKDRDYLNRAYPIEPTTVSLQDYMPNYLTRRALHELELVSQRRECGEDGNEPFVMKLSYLKPHSPCDQPEPFFSMYQPEALPPPVRDEREIDHFNTHLRDYYQIWSQLDESRALKHRAQYFGSVSLVDMLIGEVIQKLKDLNLFDNTLIILTADHGDMLCDHYFQQKGLFFEPSVKVPLIFSGPGIPTGKRIAENVSHIDLLPTMLDYCDLYMPRLRDPKGRLIYADQEETESISLLPYFNTSEPVAPERIIVAENAMRGQRIMLKQGDLKINYYVNPGAAPEVECYDLRENPEEMNFRCRPVTVADLSEPLQTTLNQVLEKSQRHAERYYYFQDKIRPVFT